MASNAIEVKKDNFVKQWYSTALAVAQKLSVPVDAILGQWAIETDWGNKVVYGTGYNVGNIKAGSSWKGKSIQAYDRAENSNDFYRVYSSPSEFATDYLSLLSTDRFKKVSGSSTALQYFQRLQSGKLKYATNPNYVAEATATSASVKKTMDNLGLKSDGTADAKTQSLLEKFGMALKFPLLAPLMGAGQAVEGGKEVAENVVEAVNPMGLVDMAGNFALRSTVIVSAVALIMIGFYFMFKQEINATIKAVA